jgi:hypothetical protein
MRRLQLISHVPNTKLSDEYSRTSLSAPFATNLHRTGWVRVFSAPLLQTGFENATIANTSRRKTFTWVAVAMLFKLVTDTVVLVLPLSIVWGNTLDGWVILVQNRGGIHSGD